ncbi:hypothetical protein VPNG_09097 [Cytospora leucostoma]|uniref:EamA domain-containing protein n=1 Tax=Cytospora leucostoma TaxID=1230097 RepID=A0A423VP66_9PEZI|nr:hypothetical protein VPNG_09097 [Cytospora leucostoma]
MASINRIASNVSQVEDDDVSVTHHHNKPSVWRSIWENNQGALLILLSEVCSSSMDAIARFLQQGGTGFPTLQLIVARMGVTFILSTLYMWWKQVPYFPLGNPEVRLWLVLRALFGFVGLFTLYYSVHYLPLAEATVFRFLVPIVTAWACSVFLGQPFTRKELTAGVVALVGVVFIAHPEGIFGRVEGDAAAHAGSSNSNSNPNSDDLDQVAPAQRMLAIAVALVGIFGASGAYTFIRIIGSRAHTLMSVNYFAFVATLGSTAALLVLPGMGFVMPASPREWALLLFMGVLGFVLQFLLTRGLTLDKSPKATSMLYTQVLFALAFDWAIWGVLPSGWSLFGGAIVIASTLWSALHKTKAAAPKEASKVVDEESALLGAQTEE